MHSIKQLLLATFFLFQTVAQARDGEIKHYMANDANLIETQRGYALSAPDLMAKGWKTVSVNGDQIQTISSNCHQNVMNKREFSGSQDRRAALDEAIRFLKSIESNNRNGHQGDIYRSGVATYSLTGNMASVTSAYNMGASTFQSNGLSLTKFNDQNMSIGKSSGLPNNLNRIFITGDVVTFVYRDGRVNMKPSNCLQDNENRIVQQLKRDSQKAQTNFNNNMNQFNHQMNQNMNQMNQNLNNAFNRNNFPFNFNPFQNDHNQHQQGGYGLNFGFNGPQFLSQAANVIRNIPGVNLFGRSDHGHGSNHGGFFSSLNLGR